MKLLLEVFVNFEEKQYTTSLILRVVRILAIIKEYISSYQNRAIYNTKSNFHGLEEYYNFNF